MVTMMDDDGLGSKGARGTRWVLHPPSLPLLTATQYLPSHHFHNTCQPLPCHPFPLLIDRGNVNGNQAIPLYHFRGWCDDNENASKQQHMTPAQQQHMTNVMEWPPHHECWCWWPIRRAMNHMPTTDNLTWLWTTMIGNNDGDRWWWPPQYWTVTRFALQALRIHSQLISCSFY